FLISIDGNDIFSVQKPDEQLAPNGQRRQINVAVNPFGTNGAVNTFGMLGEIGFSVPPGQSAGFSRVVASILRSPSHVLISEDLSKSNYDGLYANSGDALQIKDGSYHISGGRNGASIVRDPSHNSMPMLRTKFATQSKKLDHARLYVTA